ncbi:hypothetical protein CY35_10G046000 [Sphagnum magellanicum]|nr:hypothetical protein CY35_10G046000 [Sphagnum magellanicum]
MSLCDAEIGIGPTGFWVLFTFLDPFCCWSDAYNWHEVNCLLLPQASQLQGIHFVWCRFWFGDFGWAVVGMIIEAYGFILLFSGFWPTVVVFLDRVPVLGQLLQQPFLMLFFDRFTRTEQRVPV